MVSMHTKESNRLQAVTRITAAGAAVLMMILAGCASRSPEEKTAAMRSRYTADLNGFFVRQEPVAPAMAEMEEGMEAAEEGAPTADEAGEMEEMAAAPVELSQDATLDVLVRHESSEKLAGITVDIVMQSTSGQEKGSWTMWVETADLEKGTHLQLTQVLEDVPYEEGDGFFVEIRSPIPTDEQADYPEFAPGG